MSQLHIHKPDEAPPPTPPRRIALLSMAAFIGIVCVAAAVALTFIWFQSFTPEYRTANGRILETRKVVDQIFESKYGSRVSYRYEVRVAYSLNGHPLEHWMRVEEDQPTEQLLVKLAAHPVSCRVFWPPDYPDGARCSLP